MKAKYIIFLLVFLISCKRTNRVEDIRRELTESGFNETIWKFDSLSYYSEYRQIQAGIVNTKKSALVGQNVNVVTQILGEPYNVFRENSSSHFVLQYLIENIGKVSENDKAYFKVHGLDVYKLEISVNAKDSIVTDVWRSM